MWTKIISNSSFNSQVYLDTLYQNYYLDTLYQNYYLDTLYQNYYLILVFFIICMVKRFPAELLKQTIAEFRNLVRKLILRRQAQSMCKKIHAKLELQLQMNLLIQLPSSIRSCMILLINNFSVLRGGAVHIPPLSKINFVTFLHYHQPLEN